MANFILGTSVVAVPTDFIKNNMKDINGAFIKVYLYALYLASVNKSCNFDEIAKELGLLESEVILAFETLDKKGVLSFDGENVTFYKASENNTTIIEKKDKNNIKEELLENKALAELCTLAEQTFGRVLSNNDLEILYWIYDDLKLPSEVILIIIEYCISKDKTSMKYVQKVAITWKEQEINTLEKAIEFINKEEEKSSIFYRLRKTFGILDRPLGELEAQYLTKWHNEWNMSEDMIEYAYNLSLIRTNKLSYEYMDSIINNWYDNNISTVDEAKENSENFKSKSSPASFNDKKEQIKNDNGAYDNLAELTQNMD